MADERYDPELWIAVAGPLRLYLLGKAHTFHGHMRTWDPDADQVLYVSKTEIVSASPAARHWIDGFSAGERAFAERVPPSSPRRRQTSLTKTTH